MKKFLYFIVFLIFSFIQLNAYANEQEAIEFFNNYENLANQWSLQVIDMYSSNPVIKRNVLKKTPVTVIVPFNEHKKMLETYNKNKKLLIGIKNNYKNKKVTNLGNDKYKISAERCPTIMNRCFDCYMIIQKQNGQYKIIEESSDVKSTYFLKFKD